MQMIGSQQATRTNIWLQQMWHVLLKCRASGIGKHPPRKADGDQVMCEPLP